jgi:ribose transport system ATP-binding protein
MIEVRAINKTFGANRVLRDVNFEVSRGQLLGLVGENGAGKSTLMNILGGNLRPDSGEMRLDGKPYQPRTPADASRCGIAFIHQELNLFPNLSIAENLFLTGFPKVARVLIDRREARAKAGGLLREVGLDLQPETLVDRLSAGERQLVEVAKALSLDIRLIIFDEPTTSLSAREAQTLFALIERMRSRGISMIYISHTLEDVLQLSQQIVVLRDGEVVGSGERNHFTIERLITLMIGRSLRQLYPPRLRGATAEVVLEAKELTQPGIVRGISFQLRRGEILGIFGLMGAGRSELARILFGLERCQEGQLLLKRVPLSTASPRRRMAAGLAFLTESRREEGLCLEASIADNIILVSLRRYAAPGLGILNRRSMQEDVERIRHAVRLTPTAPDEQSVGTLSGGNQQKVVLAKWLLGKPAAMILDEPTRGIDVGAKFEVYQLINEQADHGAGVLLISSEIEELIGVCDRILVMAHGEIRDEFMRANVDRERIMRAALGAAQLPRAAQTS